MKVAVILTARPSWAKLSPVCHALKARSEVELQLIVCASALLERYGNVAALVEREFPITERVYSVTEGESLETSAIEVGILETALARTFARLKPDVVIACADRHEILAVAGAARMLEITLVHLQGGELSGSVDHDIRNAVTQLADVHCVCTQRAAMRVYGLTGSDAITVTGCPSIDVAKQAQLQPPVTAEELGGAGEPIDLTQPFVTILHHPTTTEVSEAAAQMALLISQPYTRQAALVFWPGEDAGAGAMSKMIRQAPVDVHTVRNLPPHRFLRLLTQTACLIGNSSAGIREASYLGVPVVNVGRRQQGRERAANVRDIDYNGSDLAKAVEAQIGHGPYKSSALYGCGDAGPRIAEVVYGLR